MDKKRRNNFNCDEIVLDQASFSICDVIAEKKNCINDEGFVVTEYLLKPEYGKGTISNIELEELFISISRFKLKKDLIINNTQIIDRTQLSFLLEGEKIISIAGNKNDILYESQESYLATIDNLKINNRISGGKPIKEIKIIFSSSYLLNHGFSNAFIFQKISNKNLIVPINDEVLAVLNNLEEKGLKGLQRKLYLEAKILELLALQLECYEDGNSINNGNKDKTIKKLYVARQILKDNLNKKISIKELSLEIGLNENILKSEFKRVFSHSINEFRINEKMSHAKELLKNSQRPIYEIAEDIGYRNATHFSAAFKKYYRKTPKEFRNIL